MTIFKKRREPPIFDEELKLVRPRKPGIWGWREALKTLLVICLVFVLTGLALFAVVGGSL